VRHALSPAGVPQLNRLRRPFYRGRESTSPDGRRPLLKVVTAGGRVQLVNKLYNRYTLFIFRVISTLSQQERLDIE
jgi:hypothetical protein